MAALCRVAVHPVTGNADMLDEPVQFLQAPLLKPGPRGRNTAGPSRRRKPGTLYEHCARAIDVSLEVGVHGLPLIGTCDWNDGFSEVGAEGKGESTWMAWFLLQFLDEFAELAQRRGDAERREKSSNTRNDCEPRSSRSAGMANGMSAFFDDGTPLGSHRVSSAKLIPRPKLGCHLQAGRSRSAERAMHSVWSRLVRT